MPRRFDLDALELGRKYKELSRKLHPDRFAKADAQTRRFSLERATQVNDAYKVLKDPVARAEYLLRLAGVKVADESQGGESVDQEFLMEIMEQREALAEARLAGDARKLEELGAMMRGRRDAAMRAVAEGFEKSARAEVAKELTALRYYDRFLHEIDVFEDEHA